MSVREEHAVAWNTSLVDLDIDPFTECSCGNQLPCPIRVAYEEGLADARALVGWVGDPEPQPEDGPDYHAEHAAWAHRQAEATAWALPDR